MFDRSADKFRQRHPRKRLSGGLFYRDTAGHMDATDPVGENLGLMKRAAFTSASNVVELLTPIHSDIFFQ